MLGISSTRGGWTGDVKLLDWEEVQKADHPNRITVKIFKAEEVNFIKNLDEFIFPIANGDLLQPGDRRIERTTRKRVVWRNPRQDTEGSTTEGDEGQPDPSGDSTDTDSMPDPEDAEPECLDTWTTNNDVLIRHHLTPRQKLFIPTVEDCPIPLKFLDVMRTTETDLPLDKS